MDTTLLLGLGAAVAASGLYNGGVALQALDAREVPTEHGLRPSLMGRLVRQPRWLAGTVMGVLGWPLQTAALVAAPLTLVQPALATGVILLFVIGSRMMGHRLSRIDIAAMCAILLGVAGLALASPRAPNHLAEPEALAAALFVIGAFSVAPYLLGRHGRISQLAAVGAGAGYAWSGVSTDLVARSFSHHHWGICLIWAIATGIASGLALLSEMTALQTRPATRVVPVVFSVQVIVPVALAPALVGERWGNTTADVVLVLLSLIVLLAGAIRLGSSPVVAGVIEGGESGERPIPAEPREPRVPRKVEAGPALDG
jgi:drug/metabolite transporter (DMT)-like permease